RWCRREPYRCAELTERRHARVDKPANRACWSYADRGADEECGDGRHVDASTHRFRSSAGGGLRRAAREGARYVNSFRILGKPGGTTRFGWTPCLGRVDLGRR